MTTKTFIAMFGISALVVVTLAGLGTGLLFAEMLFSNNGGLEWDDVDFNSLAGQTKTYSGQEFVVEFVVIDAVVDGRYSYAEGQIPDKEFTLLFVQYGNEKFIAGHRYKGKGTLVLRCSDGGYDFLLFEVEDLGREPNLPGEFFEDTTDPRFIEPNERQAGIYWGCDYRPAL